MAGHFAAMAEFLRRGYNVAIPAVDIGDDIVVIEDADRKTRRVQVKTANFSGGRLKFSNIDLIEPGTFFMLTTWIEDQWHYLFVRQEDLLRADVARRTLRGRGRVYRCGRTRRSWRSTRR